MIVALMSQAVGMERMRPRALLGIALSIGGVAVVVFGSAHHTHGQGSWLGIGLVLTAVACWSIFTVLVRPYTLRVDMVQLNSLTMMGGMIPLLFVTPAAITGTVWSGLSFFTWLVVAYSSVLSMGIVYIFWFGGVRVLGPTRTSVYANLQPVVAILFAWVALHEAPTLWQGLGAATIITGIMLSRR
jgi:drug/metabolite transporter (DMT)-like permease